MTSKLTSRKGSKSMPSAREFLRKLKEKKSLSDIGIFATWEKWEFVVIFCFSLSQKNKRIRMEDIINLRDNMEELEDLPIQHWKELQNLRKYILELELKRITKALKFVKTATVEEFKAKALGYKRHVEYKMEKKESETTWPPKVTGGFAKVEGEIRERQ